ncbi:MAG: ABC transporter ATP-binding protein/permease [Clostridia bacterium]|nr:ABC transporter ATP-binding protein/permease [Clostridia bacterium]
MDGNKNQKKAQDYPRSYSGGEAIRVLIRRLRDGTYLEILDDWKWIFRYTKRYRAAVLFFVAAGILSTSLGLLGSIAGKYLIDIVTGYKTDKLAILILVTVGSALGSMFFNAVVDRISAKLSIGINNDIQADIYDKIMDADWYAITRYPSGDILNRFTADIGTVAGNAVGWVPKLIVACYRFAATFFVLLFYDPIMALMALAGAPFLLVVSRRLIGRQRAYSKQVKGTGSRLTSFEVESFANFDTVKSFGITDLYSRRLRTLQGEFRKNSLDYQLFSLKTNIFLQIIGMLVQYAAFGYCLFRLWSHAITYGTMTLFLQQHSGLSSAFNGVVGMIPALLNSSVSAHRIRELTELPREQHTDAEQKANLPASGVSVVMEQVDFAYDAERPVLKQSDFVAAPGEIVALVGASGEGKTTMVRLILGLIHPQSGSAHLISADGTMVPLSADIRSLFSYVPQGNTIISGTIADNLRMVREDADETMMIEALKTACAWEFVSAMPGGLSADVGERGRGLSEGQAQRIAIARAILRDAPVMLLDEATSALDVATERKVLKNLMTGDTKRTCIVTTHRPSVLTLCRRVYRVEGTILKELDPEESAKLAMDF